MRADRWAGGEALPYLLVLLAGLAAFAPSLGNGFVWDDRAFILNNLVLDDPGNFPRFLVSGDAVGTSGQNPYYRPATTLSFALDKLVWGDDPLGFHLTNLLLHLGVCLVVLWILRQFTRNGAASLAAGLLFAIHPAHAEPVAYVSARADLLCALLTLGSFASYLRWSRGGGRWVGVWLAFSLLLFPFALFAKIPALLLPVLILLHLALVERGPWRKALVLVPFAAISLGFLALRSEAVVMDSWVQLPLLSRISTAGGVFLSQLLHAAVPLGLLPYYQPNLTMPLTAPAVVAGWGAFLALAGLAVWWAFRLPAASLGVALFLGALFPTLGVFFIIFPAPVADRFLYLPLAGAALAAGVLGDRLLQRPFPRPARAALAGALALALLVGVAASESRTGDWRDELSLWTKARLGGEENPTVICNLAGALSQAGRHREAEALYQRLLDLNCFPDLALYNLGRIAFMEGKIGMAGDRCIEALQSNPDSTWSMALLARCYLAGGRVEEALSTLDQARSLDPFSREITELIAEAERFPLGEGVGSEPPAVGEASLSKARTGGES